MTNRVQLQYNGSKPQNCSLEDVVIQSWFAAADLPTFKINMHMSCNNGLNLTVNDFTFDFWNDDYNTISQTAWNLKKFSYCSTNTSAPPYDALEYKYNSTIAYNATTYWNNIIRLFNEAGSCNINSNVDVDRLLFNSIMDAALDDVRNNTLPSIRYLCNRCGVNADWTTKIGSPIWELFYNTLNTVGSIVGLLAIIMTLGMNDQLFSLLEDKKGDKEEDTERFLK
ncbi:hypothetical protein BGX26_001334 [Mortierella sp. AD094]|nr:hypothetical protein BGX26_001334 [Mortierella sp. AD094]